MLECGQCVKGLKGASDKIVSEERGLLQGRRQQRLASEVSGQARVSCKMGAPRGSASQCPELSLGQSGTDQDEEGEGGCESGAICCMRGQTEGDQGLESELGVT